MAKRRSERPGARTGPAVTPMLRARLRPHATPEHYLRRARLLELLDDAVGAPLTAVVAPAGAGKTTTLSGWAAEASTRIAWLSLEDADRDGVQLWSGVIAALETVASGCGESARASLRRGDIAGAVDLLLLDLDGEDRSQAVLVIDDVHLVDDDDEIAGQLASFVRGLPGWLHLVLASRREPKLPLDRLRARGELGEIHFSELRFSRHEAKALLSRLAPTMSDSAIDAAGLRAEGWVASLKLSALVARSARAQAGIEVPRLGEDVLMRDYVMQEVLARETPEVVDGLLDVSVVDRVSTDLATALTGRADASDLLLTAERRGLFVSRLDARGWFEVHSLVRAALVAELARRSPSRLADQHVRAARWLEDVGEVPLAIEHLLSAGEHRRALRVLAANHGDLADEGRDATIIRTIAAIPENVATADLESILEYAWCHLLVSRRRFVEIVEQAVWRADRASSEVALRPRLEMLRSVAAAANGSWSESGTLARRALHDLGDAWWRDPVGRYGWNMIARDVALSERWEDGSDEIRHAELELGRDPQRRIAFEATRALGEALAGRPVDALRVAGGVRDAVEVSHRTLLRGELELAEALASREIGDRERAVPALEELAAAPPETMLSGRVLGGLDLALARLDDGDVDAARATFGDILSLEETEAIGSGLHMCVARTGTQIELALGEIDIARRWSEQVEDRFWSGISAARVFLAEGNREAAEGAADSAVPRCVRHEIVRGLVWARAIENHEEAVKSAVSSVDLAATHGTLQTVACEGQEVLELIEAGAWRAPPAWMDRLRRSVARLRGARVPDVRDGVEPLTGRELDVLRFLPSRLTLQEIADELYISVNTLKFHVKVIYRKLGVNSRAEAASKARTLLAKR